MKNTIKNAAYAAAGAGLLAMNTAANAIDVTNSLPVTAGDNGAGNDIVVTLNNILAYLVGLLYFVAIIFALYGGFQILTAGGDEEKVKKGKTTLINAVIGLVVIFLASTIIKWVISAFATGGAAVS